MLSAKVNFVVKTTDAKAVQVRKALSAAGIQVRAVVEVYREEDSAEVTQSANDAGNPQKKA